MILENKRKRVQKVRICPTCPDCTQGSEEKPVQKPESSQPQPAIAHPAAQESQKLSEHLSKVLEEESDYLKDKENQKVEEEEIENSRDTVEDFETMGRSRNRILAEKAGPSKNEDLNSKDTVENMEDDGIKTKSRRSKRTEMATKEQEKEEDPTVSAQNSRIKSTSGGTRVKKAKMVPQLTCCSEVADLQFNTSNRKCQADQDCRIKAMEPYMVEKKIQGSIEINYCVECFSKATDLDKKKWKRMINVNEKIEKVLSCQECGMLWHEQCSFYYDDPEEFICRSCDSDAYQTVLTDKTRTRDSDFMERTLNEFLDSKLGGDPQKKPQKISVRIVRAQSDVDTINLAPGMFSNEFLKKYKDKVQRSVRTIFVFQRQKGIEQLFFIIFTSEYPNHGDGPSWFVLDYLDSVQHFQPHSFKTEVYNEIVLTYFDWMRRTGFLKGYIWVDPPQPGDDYLLNIHPPQQKYPGPERLQNWYSNVLAKGRTRGLVREFRDFGAEKKLRKFKKPTDLPFFHASLWTNLMALYSDDMEEKRIPKSKFWTLMAPEFKGHVKDNIFIELTEPRDSEKTQEDNRTRISQDCLSDGSEFLYTLQEHDFEFGESRRALYASVGVVRMIES
ncbi:hypothetical protein L3Y34_019772 [Caenorhabditis briggsae]|uniref:histone acetyltransferase n=2 Tax=Caenorhabditis briggsae TaxID=6238 RepID=A0AAE9IWJ0_CAEBR|nr:hypothetical protein L3Y34_019772 [Caenorhabditis briggsae]